MLPGSADAPNAWPSPSSPTLISSTPRPEPMCDRRTPFAPPSPPFPPPPPPPPTVHAPSLLTVVCPENAGPGAQLIVQGPAGDLIRVTVPNQTYAGMVFHVSV
mmetsp:Transcript_20390/g.63395  ORF Transcript_20390/g.63395 Transcript_20390/m.63395 type:complete len:103 (+) Transcript_20390:322-630(+)